MRAACNKSRSIMLGICVFDINNAICTRQCGTRHKTAADDMSNDNISLQNRIKNAMKSHAMHAHDNYAGNMMHLMRCEQPRGGKLLL